LIFLLFGVSTRDREVGTQVMTCDVCGSTAPQSIFKRTTRFSLFFVPLFPVRPSRSYRWCSHCRATRPVDSALLTAAR
jgi:hypothetical protein